MPKARHGVIFRGDWSLELNRVPWMAERGTGYQGPVATCDSCQAGCLEEDVLSETGNPAFVWLSDLCLDKSSPAAHPAAPAAGAVGTGRSRFFPVPTRPVFSKRGGSVGAIEEVLVPSSPSLEIIPPPPPGGQYAPKASAKTARLR